MAEEPTTSTVRSALAIDRACDKIMQDHPRPAYVASQLREILTAVRDLRAHQVDDVLNHIDAVGARYGGAYGGPRPADESRSADALDGVDGEDDGQTQRARARADELADRVRGE